MPKMIVDGVEYEMPTRDDLRMGDLRILKRYTGVSGDELSNLPDSDPDATAGMMHVLFRRENPELSFAAIEKKVDDVKLVTIDYEADEVEEKEEDVDPSSSSATSDSKPSVGADSSESSEHSPVIEMPKPTGIQAWDTGSVSGQGIST